MKKGKIRIQVLVKFLNLCALTQRNEALPAIDEIMQRNLCSRSNAYDYLRALKFLYPQELLDQVRERRENRYIQQNLIQ